MKIETKQLHNTQVFIEAALRKFGNCDGFCFLDGHATDDSPCYLLLEPIQFFLIPNTSTSPTQTLFSLQTQIEELNCRVDAPVGLPFIAGFFSYEYLHYIEKIQKPKNDSYNIPPLYFVRYRTIVEITEGTARCFVDDSYQSPLWIGGMEDIPDGKEEELPPTNLDFKSIDHATEELFQTYSNFSREQYLETIDTIKEKIRSGEVYQVNLTQQLSVPTERTAEEIYIHLRREAHSLHGAYLNIGEGTNRKTILSASPELFFRKSGNHISVCPIKGTISRHDDLSHDKEAASELLHSEKNRAELAMIVDLMRHDLSKICIPGSVTVNSFPRLYSLPVVHHLCSDISGTIADNVKDLDIISALFPSGSITGTPKIAAMNAISLLEDTTRGIYCGSLGFFGRQISQFNVAIRTGVHFKNRFIFQVGGGITIDSDPISEWSECIHKARVFANSICFYNSFTS